MSIRNIFISFRTKASILVISSLLVSACGNNADATAYVSEEISEYDEHMDISIAYWQIDKALEGRDTDEVLKRSSILQ